MADTLTPQPIPFLPCVEANPNAPAPGVLSAETALAPFAYIGVPLSREAFRVHVQSYDFGPVAPSFVIFHHTVNPDASWAPRSTDMRTWWDRNEASLSTEQIKAKRKKQLDGMRDYYIGLGWTAGFHLLIDERWIWLFTPLDTIGVHANEGNSYRKNGKLRYSVGIEVIGYYEGRTWPTAIAQNVGWAVGCLKERLGFDLAYHAAPEDRPDIHDNSLSGHRDYSEKSCPGAAVTPAFYMSVAQAGYLAVTAPPPPPDPLATHALPGPVRPMKCGSGFYSEYYDKGNFPFFGYALTDETHAIDQSNRKCTYMVLERAIFKYTEAFGVELALLSEAKAQGWL